MKSPTPPPTHHLTHRRLPECEGWWYARTQGQHPDAAPGGQQTNGPPTMWVRYTETGRWYGAGRWHSAQHLAALVKLVDGADFDAIAAIVSAMLTSTADP